MSKIILAISAHPDDIEFACGGTMFKFKEKGYDIYLAVATNGENGFKISHKPRKERVRIRHSEQLNAAKILGIKRVFFLNYKDGFLEYDEKLREKLVRIIKEVKPEIIFTFDPANKSFENLNLLHRDHRAVAEASFDAVFASRNRYMYRGKSHYVRCLYLFGPDKPNHYENITKYIGKKINLIEVHHSQFGDYKSMAQWVKKNLSQYTRRYKYSEMFRVVRIQKPFVTEEGN
jgi:LmbE family N-acetylglucosaminyl deacetylase